MGQFNTDRAVIQEPKETTAEIQPVRLMPGFVGEGTGSTLSEKSTEKPYDSLSLLASTHEVLNFSEGETLYKEGDLAKGLYFLKSGCVKIFVSRESMRGRTTTPEYVTKLVSPGEVFGYKALTANIPSRSYAKAIRPTVVHLYKADDIAQILAKAHPLMRRMLDQAVFDINNYERTSQLHYLASVQERIANQLISLSDRFGVQTPQGISLNLKLTRNEFAQLASTINESLSRHLTEFKNEGLIDINGKEIIIKNREALAGKSGHA